MLQRNILLSLPPVFTSFLLHILFEAEDRGDTLLQKVKLSLNYTALQPR
jgi:hypothetical protein